MNTWSPMLTFLAPIWLVCVFLCAWLGQRKEAYFGTLNPLGGLLGGLILGPVGAIISVWGIPPIIDLTLILAPTLLAISISFKFFEDQEFDNTFIIWLFAVPFTVGIGSIILSGFLHVLFGDIGFVIHHESTIILIFRVTVSIGLISSIYGIIQRSIRSRLFGGILLTSCGGLYAGITLLPFGFENISLLNVIVILSGILSILGLSAKDNRIVLQWGLNLVVVWGVLSLLFENNSLPWLSELNLPSLSWIPESISSWVGSMSWWQIILWSGLVIGCMLFICSLMLDDGETIGSLGIFLIILSGLFFYLRWIFGLSSGWYSFFWLLVSYSSISMFTAKDDDGRTNSVLLFLCCAIIFILFWLYQWFTGASNWWDIAFWLALVLGIILILFGLGDNHEPMGYGVFLLMFCTVIYGVYYYPETPSSSPCLDTLHPSRSGYMLGTNNISLRILADSAKTPLYLDKHLSKNNAVMIPGTPYFVFTRTETAWQIGPAENVQAKERLWVSREQTYCWASRNSININRPVPIYASKTDAETGSNPVDKYAYRYDNHFKQADEPSNNKTMDVAALPVLQQEGDYWSFIEPRLSQNGNYPIRWIKWNGQDSSIESRVRISRRTYETYLSGVSKLFNAWRYRDQKTDALQALYDPCGALVPAIRSETEKNVLAKRHLKLLDISASETDWDNHDEIYIRRASMCQLNTSPNTVADDKEVEFTLWDDMLNYFNKWKEQKEKARLAKLEKQKQQEEEQARLAELEKQKQQALANKVSKTMVTIKPGCFNMGSNNGSSDEKPVHRVCLTQAYALGKYEVTQALWQQVMGTNPSRFKGSNRPVESISWNDVQGFIKNLNQQTGGNYRLPTEAEWEYACRSRGKNHKYCAGNSIKHVAWYNKNSGNKTHPVGQKQANDLGLYDMSGNVWEWVSDWYDDSYYEQSPTNDPKGLSGGSYRVNRGGSWRNSASLARSAYRYNSSPDRRRSALGFRLARTR